MIKKNYLLLVLSIFLSACGVPQSDYDALVAENEKLLNALDEIKNGEPRLIAIAQREYDNNNFTEARNVILKIEKLYPQSASLVDMRNLMKHMDKSEAEEKMRKEAAAKEADRLKNLSNTGMWSIVYYTDEFGEKTNEAFIWNAERIRGSFSNTATQNSALDVRFFIDGKSEVDIVLFEYAGNKPVKAYSPDKYNVGLLDNDGLRHKIYAYNRGDRLSFGPQHSSIITSSLLKGGDIKFSIYEADRPTNEYFFKVSNVEYFENALRLLAEK